MVFARACVVCEGSGHAEREACQMCRGVGVAPRSETVTLDVPAGLESGAQVVVPGRGHRGARGGGVGDLYIRVKVGTHSHLTRRGRDLHVTVPVTVTEAALGGTIQVPSLDGLLEVELPPGCGPSVTVPGQGVPAAGGRGDLVLTLQVVLPPVTTERSRALLEEFGRLHPEDVRRHFFS